MVDQLRYTMVIFWSAEDEAFLVSFPDWEGIVFNPITHGDSYEEAARNGVEAMEGLVASLTKHEETLPKVRPMVEAA